MARKDRDMPDGARTPASFSTVDERTQLAAKGVIPEPTPESSPRYYNYYTGQYVSSPDLIKPNMDIGDEDRFIAEDFDIAENHIIRRSDRFFKSILSIFRFIHVELFKLKDLTQGSSDCSFVVYDKNFSHLLIF
jgi:hypothetical protein